MPTVHIESDKKDIAKRVLMPGDPNRAYYIANKYLENAKLVNKVRGELAYTGKYKGVDVTVFSSGMGIPSMGIYSYELFNEYDVDYIIRIGTAGSYKEDLKVYDILLASSAYSLTLNSTIMDVALKKGLKLHEGRVHTSEAFYTDSKDYTPYTNQGCVAVEMETFALFHNAKVTGKKATAIVTISDNLVTHEKTTSEERQNSFVTMIKLALESAIEL